MDPNEALRQIRQLVGSLSFQIRTESDLDESEVEELLTTFDGLDNWLTRKGFLPVAWGGTLADRVAQS